MYVLLLSIVVLSLSIVVVLSLSMLVVLLIVVLSLSIVVMHQKTIFEANDWWKIPKMIAGSCNLAQIGSFYVIKILLCWWISIRAQSICPRCWSMKWCRLNDWNFSHQMPNRQSLGPKALRSWRVRLCGFDPLLSLQSRLHLQRGDWNSKSARTNLPSWFLVRRQNLFQVP